MPSNHLVTDRPFAPSFPVSVSLPLPTASPKPTPAPRYSLANSKAHPAMLQQKQLPLDANPPKTAVSQKKLELTKGLRAPEPPVKPVVPQKPKGLLAQRAQRPNVVSLAQDPQEKTELNPALRGGGAPATPALPPNPKKRLAQTTGLPPESERLAEIKRPPEAKNLTQLPEVSAPVDTATTAFEVSPFSSQATPAEKAVATLPQKPTCIDAQRSAGAASLKQHKPVDGTYSRSLGQDIALREDPNFPTTLPWTADILGHLGLSLNKELAANKHLPIFQRAKDFFEAKITATGLKEDRLTVAELDGLADRKIGHLNGLLYGPLGFIYNVDGVLTRMQRLYSIEDKYLEFKILHEELEQLMEGEIAGENFSDWLRGFLDSANSAEYQALVGAEDAVQLRFCEEMREKLIKAEQLIAKFLPLLKTACESLPPETPLPNSVPIYEPPPPYINTNPTFLQRMKGLLIKFFRRK